jgi:hypothetical protein
MEGELGGGESDRLLFRPGIVGGTTRTLLLCRLGGSSSEVWKVGLTCSSVGVGQGCRPYSASDVLQGDPWTVCQRPQSRSQSPPGG